MFDGQRFAILAMVFSESANKYHNKKKIYFEASSYILFVRPSVAVVDKQTVLSLNNPPEKDNWLQFGASSNLIPGALTVPIDSQKP